MPDLKLIALDVEDIAVISAHLQDAVLRVADMVYLPAEKRFVTMLNRFDWEGALRPAKPRTRRNTGRFERRRTGLRFERVLGASVQGIDLKDRRASLALLAISFTPSAEPDSPEGYVVLTFSGGAAIRLNVECLEAEMKDQGAAWSAKNAPDHPDDVDNKR